MASQQKLIYIDEEDLKNTIIYLKDYSLLIGKSYHQTQDFKIQQQIASINFDLNKLIKRLEKE